jgi:alanyl-tRNA synthetase
MTHRIYYTDPACRSFEATVRQTVSHEGRPAVLLDRTAFYPTSGGQPFDVGRLQDVAVLDVIDRDDGEVVHVVTSALDEGQPVHGEIDWPRRFDHMQQHTGQHVLSASFARLFDAQTTSFHLGAESATIDLGREVTPEQIAEAEMDANRIVWEDRPVTIRFASAEEAASLPLRKEPARSGTLRLIDIEGFDLSACGGTHVARTGAIGLIGVVGWERFKGGTRVTFVCGGRALRSLRDYRDSVTGSIRLLSVLPKELPSAIERAQAEAKDLRRSVKQLQESLAGHEAARLVTAAVAVGAHRAVVQALDNWDAAGLKAIASAATGHAGILVALFSTAAPVVAVLARSKDVSVDLPTIFKQLVARFGGRGGGRPDLVQGGGFNAPVADVVAATRDLFGLTAEGG